jgi:hypothetical protein
VPNRSVHFRFITLSIDPSHNGIWHNHSHYVLALEQVIAPGRWSGRLRAALCGVAEWVCQFDMTEARAPFTSPWESLYDRLQSGPVRRA